MANSPLSNLPTLTEWLKAHPGEHLLPAATVAREAGIKETTLRAYAARLHQSRRNGSPPPCG